MTPQEAIKHFGIIKIENKNVKGEVIQTLIDFKIPNRCEHGHKTDATVIESFAKGLLAVIAQPKETEVKTTAKI